MTATCTQTKWAQPAGQYQPTAIDAIKLAADFRLTACDSKNTIVWKDGSYERVTDAKLAKLQAAHTWATDF